MFDRPYRQPLDFGVEYAPHELVARAHDAKGKEIAVARQWINLPRPPAEVQIVLEKDKSGKAVAVGLAWASRMGPRPTGVVLTFDGQPLPVDIARHARLPEYDASLPHVVSAEVEFPGDLHGRADRVLGGGSADEAGSELTAVPVRGPNERPPSVESLQGRFRKNGEALRVVAVEHGPALVFLVRDPAENKEAFRRFGPVRPQPREGRDAARDRRSHSARLAARHGDPRPERVERALRHRGDHSWREHELPVRASAVRERAPRARANAGSRTRSPSRGSRRRRTDPAGPSCWSWERATRTTAAGPRPRSGITWSASTCRSTSGRFPGRSRRSGRPRRNGNEFEDISTVGKLHDAASRVQNDLARQSIVWIEGRHLPQDITLVDAGDGIGIAR